jgi:hypothetical protein
MRARGFAPWNLPAAALKRSIIECPTASHLEDN